MSQYNGTAAESMGHTEVDTQFIYIQTAGEAREAAAEEIGAQLATIGHNSDEAVEYVT